MVDANPIKPTPDLYGRDAYNFLKQLEDDKKWAATPEGAEYYRKRLEEIRKSAAWLKSIRTN